MKSALLRGAFLYARGMLYYTKIGLKVREESGNAQ